MKLPNIEYPMSRSPSSAVEWKIVELSAFGSVLRDDFRPDSDVDLLVSFAPDAELRLFEQMAMEEELSEMLGRSVDLASRRGVEQSENWIRRRQILESVRQVSAICAPAKSSLEITGLWDGKSALRAFLKPVEAP